MPLSHGAGDPSLEERAGYAIASFESGDAGTDSRHFARAIGKGNQVAGHRTAEVISRDNHLIAIIERCGPDSDKNFAGPGLWVRPFGWAQTIEAGGALLNFVNFHLYDCTD
jgi:hypothetical protein